MRLIDANALIITLMDKDLDHVQADDGLELCQIIDEQPTVKDIFSHLDGASDGLRQSNKMVIEGLQEIRQEIERRNIADFIAVQSVIEIIDDKIKEYTD